MNKVTMETKLEMTVEKTIEALERIQRFVVKYVSELNDNQKERIATKIQELQDSLAGL